MQHSQMLKMPKKRVFALFSSSPFKICFRNANNGICSFRKCSTFRKTRFPQCSHHQVLNSALETQIKAYVVFANVQCAEKRYLTLISSSTFENCFRNANNGICSIRKCSTCRKTLFDCDFNINF